MPGPEAGMGKRTAVLIMGASLATAGAVVRLARPGDAGALDAAAAAAVGSEAAGLIVVTDPECPACASALDELRCVVRPEELGLSVRVLESRGEGLPLLEALGPGLLPALVVTGPGGRPVATLRGRRPPEVVRAWLESASARALAMPLDRDAGRGPP
jgi:hypothetical protein